MSKSRKRKNLVELVTEKMGKRLHTSPKELQKHIPFYEILFEDNERAYDFKEYFKLDDEEIKLFRSRKIPASVEKKRIKELQKQQELEEKEIQKEKEQLLKNQSNSKKSTDKKQSKKLMEENSEIKDVSNTINSELTSSKTKKDKKSIKTKNKSEESVKSAPKESENKGNDKKESKTKKYKQTTLFDF